MGEAIRRGVGEMRGEGEALRRGRAQRPIAGRAEAIGAAGNEGGHQMTPIAVTGAVRNVGGLRGVSGGYGRSGGLGQGSEKGICGQRVKG